MGRKGEIGKLANDGRSYALIVRYDLGLQID